MPACKEGVRLLSFLELCIVHTGTFSSSLGLTWLSVSLDVNDFSLIVLVVKMLRKRLFSCSLLLQTLCDIDINYAVLFCGDCCVVGSLLLELLLWCAAC